MVILAFVLFCGGVRECAAWDSSKFAGGAGTESSPYLIADATQLTYLASEVNSGASSSEGVFFKLTQSIVVSDWTPIGVERYVSGDYVNYFHGVFDGSGYAVDIQSLGNDLEYVGLFGYVYGRNYPVVIKNVTVTGTMAPVTSQINVAIGAIIGQSQNKVTVQNCAADVTINTIGVSAAMWLSVGGIIGTAGQMGFGVSSTVKNCRTDVTMPSMPESEWCEIGGIVGDAYSTNISNCYSAGTLIGFGTYTAYVGGIIGNSSILGSSDVRDCYSKASVKSLGYGDNRAGGIAGNLQTGSVNHCVALNIGVIASGGSSDYAGAVIGYNRTSNAANCYAILSGDSSNTYKYDGTSVSAAACESESWWSTNPGVFSSVWSQWKWDNAGKSPVLAWETISAAKQEDIEMIRRLLVEFRDELDALAAAIGNGASDDIKALQDEAEKLYKKAWDDYFNAEAVLNDPSSSDADCNAAMETARRSIVETSDALTELGNAIDASHGGGGGGGGGGCNTGVAGLFA
ncbi:MAG: hypothetical protein LBG12_06150, partial [Synergistaceae bacterium]|nr:hypothetical protein [Synergistaceae bacterium]